LTAPADDRRLWQQTYYTDA